MTKKTSKKIILILCLTLYTLVYFCRSNLSAVLDKMMFQFHIGPAKAGLIGSVFFWTYAMGQIISGYLADKANPKKLIFYGMTAAMLSNLVVGTANSYILVLVMWGVNGLCLSLIWPSTFRILMNWFSTEEYGMISVYISLPTTLGYMVAVCGLRIIGNVFHWRLAFYIPAALVFCFLFIWKKFLVVAPDEEEKVELARDSTASTDFAKATPISRLIVTYGLIFIGIAAIVQGLIKESISLFGPSILSETSKAMGENVVSLLFVLIPLLGTVGIMFTGWLIKKFKNDVFAPLFLIFALAFLFSLGLSKTGEMFWPTIVLLSLLMAVICGANAILTVYIPTTFVKFQKSAQISGLLNFLVYMGAVAGGLSTGYAKEHFGFSGIYLFFAILSILGLFAILIWKRRYQKL
ncbi:MFS transporter [Anaerosporobacter sp.]|uniref:MFS transporter n=1 Tax=Anaerosporobacter sp. TaxID=1872529 RepID=UPI00286EFBB1|nr:MFS transporter [Anaerosporobacter sp.]